MNTLEVIEMGKRLYHLDKAMGLNMDFASIENRVLKLIRVKSIEKSEYTVDKKTGLKYATNEQIIKDIRITKNNYTKKVWIQMLSRYKKLFVSNYFNFKSLIPKQRIVNYEQFGV